jgi:hypothetical protein
MDAMSLRDHFAAAALVECIRVAADQTAPGAPAPMLGKMFEKAAAYAYFVADAMLKERDRTSSRSPS